MKRIFAILLMLALLLPMGMITAGAEEAAKAPFYMTNWVAPPMECDYVYGAAFMHASTSATSKDIANGIFSAVVRGATGTTPESVAAGLVELFKDYPDGTRYISFSALHKAIHEWADICFAEDVPAKVSAWLDKFLAEYKRLGGKLDGLNIDIEYTNMYYYYIETEFAKKDPSVYSKIEQMPAYKEKIRPQLVERGFKFYENVTELTPELYAIHRSSGAQYASSRTIWNVVLRNYMASIVEEACAPLFDYYPDAMLSDYRSKDVMPWVGVYGDDGGMEGGGGIRYATGNAGNEMFYSVRPGTKFFKDGNVPVYSVMPGCADALYENSIFERLQYDVNEAKTSYQASANKRLNWVTAHQYYHEEYSYNAYYTESMYHFGLLNPEVFVGYILQQDCETNGKDDVKKYHAALETADDIMEELTRVAGYSDRKAIAVSADWNHGFILSGMYAGGRNIWRITPDDTKVSLESFKVKDTDPTFVVGGETVTFPGGKIITDGKISDVGSYGYWVETAADVMPVITREDDFYRRNTGYQENYNQYETGMEYTYANALPVACWELKKQGSGSAKVIADPANANNKVLELKGSMNVKNVYMPGNIWAGDSYAEHQGWELTATLPADLAADAELILLYAANEKKKSNDGGFKITGGKVFYSQDGEYVEMAGVTLTAGSKYTFVREMNFTDAENFTCDYYIYDAEGKEVGSAKKITMEELVLPVYSVSFGCAKVTGEAVLVDDYRLYATRVNADFKLYNAATGMKIEKIDQAQSGDVAYRFSWLNATNQEKTYTVMAAYYDGATKVSEEVVKEVKMAANTDCVDFGVVENKQAGKKMVVYLKDNNPAEEKEEFTTPGGDEPVDELEPADPNRPMKIIIAGVVAVMMVIGSSGVYDVIRSKKKKKNANQETTEE